MSMSIRIALAEDNSFLADSITERLSFFEDLNLKFWAKNGEEMLSNLDVNNNIDVVLMDIQMPKLDGISTTRILKSKYPQIKVIMLTVFDDDDNIFNAIQAGADGYLLKETLAKDLYDGIQQVLSGGAAMTPSIATKTLNLIRNPNRREDVANAEGIEPLTKRETEILEHLSKGLSYIAIGDNLNISPHTVRKHLENVYKKLQVHNKIEAVQKAKENRFIQ